MCPGVVPRCADAAAAGPSVFRGGPVTASTLEERHAIAARQRAAAIERAANFRECGGRGFYNGCLSVLECARVR